MSYGSQRFERSAALLRAAVMGSLVVGGLAMGARAAHAEDDRSDSLTLIPGNHASVVVTPSESRGQLEMSTLSKSYLLSLRASVPLDHETRVREFVGEGQLVSGYSAGLQVGFDQRAYPLAELDETLARLSTAIGVLRTPPLNMDLRSAYVQKHALKNNANAITRHFCGPDPAAPCELASDVPRAICTALNRPCDDVFDLAQAATEASRAALSGSSCSSFFSGAVIDRCFAAIWWLFIHEHEATVRKIAVYFREPGSVDATWRTLVAADPRRAATLLAAGGNRKAQVLLDNREEILGVLQAAHRAAALSRRDFMLTGIRPSGRLDNYAILFDGNLAYDRFDVRPGDVQQNPVSTERSHISIGGVYTSYPKGSTGLALTARAGLEHSQASGAVEAQLCTPSPGLPTVQCSGDVLLLPSSTPDGETSLYLRGALTYQLQRTPTRDDVIPGGELRLDLDNLGSGATISVRPTLFATAIKGSFAARFGVSFDLLYRIGTDGNEQFTHSRWAVAPMFFFGTSFASLPVID